MKKIKSLFLLVICILGCFTTTFAADIPLTVGTYTSSGDEHKIVISGDNTVKYEDKYSLTIKASDSGDTITGKIGTNNKAVTFYQLNESTLISSRVDAYTHNSVSTYLYDFTAFRLVNSTANVDENGVVELWRNNTKVNTFADLQSAIDMAQDGDEIKITSDIKLNQGAYVAGKNIIIDGGNNKLDRSDWYNSVFVVEEDAILTLKNIVIDGGAKGFEVDYEAVTFTNYNIPIVSGSDSSDPKVNLSAIITKGTLVTDGMEINNNYSATAGSGIRVISGKIDVKNSSFEHNRSNHGGAIYVGSELKSNQTEYPIESIKITDSEFSKNYSTGSGGAIYFYNTTDVKIDGSKFYDNVTTQSSGYGYGGAIIFNKQSSAASKKGLNFIQAKINDCEFVGNWCGNDGFAIQNYDAELETTNSIFKENIGVHPSSSVATYSMQVNAKSAWPKEKLKGCTFEANKGSISCIADHGGQALLTIEDCQFNENIGTATCYFLTSIVNIKNCDFINELVGRSVIDGNSYSEVSEYAKLEEYKAPHIIVEDCNFENIDKPSFILRRNDARYPLNNQLHILGVVNGTIDVWHGMDVVVKGTLNGDIIADRETTSGDITILESGTVNGNISYEKNSYRATIRYNIGESVQILGYDQKIIFLEENRVYTPAELYLIHSIGSGEAKLEYYTDSARTVAWDYKLTGNMTLYTKWAEHEHVFEDSNYIAQENKIYEYCECGYTGKAIGLEVLSSFVYDETEKELSIINELNILDSEYTISYEYNENDEWKAIDEKPVNVGKYRGVLTFENLSAYAEFEITKATPKITVNNLSQIVGSVKAVTYEITPAITDGNVKVEYKISSAEDLEYTEVLPTGVGTYSVRVSVEGDSNLEDTQIVKTLVISQKRHTSSFKPRYTIEVIENLGGNITPNTTRVTKGTNRTFKIKADEGFEIEDVLVDGKSVGVVEEYVFEKVTEKHTIEVKFKETKKEENIESKEEWKNPFKDVGKTDWFYSAIEFVNSNKLMNGMTQEEFAPNVKMTRGMLVTILWRLEKEPVVNYLMQFEDVDVESYYGEAARWAASEKLVNGISDEEFNPNGDITREQLVTILYRYAVKNGKDVSVGENTNILSYEDFDELYEYAIPAMQWACGDGIIQGRTESTLNPKDTASRAEIATIIMRFIEK